MKQLRADYVAESATWAPEDLVFLDECGINLAMRLMFGWGPRGQRVEGERPVHRGNNVTVVGAITLQGPLQVNGFSGSLDGDGFVAWLEAYLLPRLRRGQILIMDNLRVHKVKAVKDLLDQHGVKAVFLPPYSPDLNPIEECWSKVKHWIRKVAPRTLDELLTALQLAVQKVTSSDAAGWFGHAGYVQST